MTTDPGEASGPFVRALSFGSVAESYQRYRLGYADELIDTVIGYAERPVRTGLEVGAGTGKATRLFAERGLEVTALDPDPAMLAVMEKVVDGLCVRPIVTTFERFRTEFRFDLVYAAAAWHWTDPATRWARATDLLAPGGVLALFGGEGSLKDPDLLAVVEEIEKHVLGDEPNEFHPWSIEDLTAVDGLVDVEQREVPGVTTTTAADFVGRLSTVSAYLRLAPDVRAETLRQVRAVLPDHVDIDTTMRLSLARRA